MKISSSKFIILFALFLTLINFKFFSYAINLTSFNDNKAVILTLPIMFFALMVLILNILFVKFTTKAVAIFISITAIAAAYFMNSYSTVIDMDMIKNATQTDITEIRDLLSWYMLLWLAGLIIIITFILKTKIEYKIFFKELKNRAIMIIIAIVIFVGIFGSLSKNYIPFFRTNSSVRFYTTPFYPIYSMIKYVKSTAKKPEFKYIGQDANRTSHSKKLFVFVVGETARSANYSLNGYTKHDTNPYTRGSGVLSFSEFTSCGTSTAISVPCMFSDLTRSNFSAQKADNMSNLLDIMKIAGIDISWFDNNSGYCKGVCDRLDEQKSYGGGDVDGVMLKDITKKIDDLNKTAFIVVHLQGSHGPTYFKRYPKEFDKFRPTCNTAILKNCSHEEIVNTYDNSILYTDYFLNNLIKLIEKKENEFDVGLFYVSDHGESLGENGLYLHGMPYAFAPDFQKHVPAILWLSDKNLLNSLKSHKNDKLSQDYVFHSMLGFFDITTKVYKPNLDFFKLSTKE